MSPVVLILSSVFLGVIGQLILKAGMTRIGPLALRQDRPYRTAWRVFSTPVVWIGLSLYGLGTFFWLVALSQVELGYAYPFISLSYVLILMTSWWLFGEKISPMRALGVLVICVGVYAAASG